MLRNSTIYYKMCKIYYVSVIIIFILKQNLCSNIFFNLNEPLYLSKYIERGDIENARIDSKVVLEDFKNVDSHSGYLTVNRKECNSNLFFWYFPSVNNCLTAPVILWLQGGPGSSSIQNGLFREHGPFVLKNHIPSLRHYSWNLFQSVIYIDNPVQTGFSFSENSSCYASNQTDVSNDLYEALIQFFKIFPELRNNDFFIAGESYGGKYVPAIAYKILKSNPKAKIEEKINLIGIAIGNGWTDPENQIIKYGEHLFNLGLIDKIQKDDFDESEQKVVELIKTKKFKEAHALQDKILMDLNDSEDLYKNYTGLSSYYNIIETHDKIKDNSIEIYLNRKDIKKAIHVGDRKFNDGIDAVISLYDDLMQTIAPWVSELLSNYRVLFYNGQLDIICAYSTQVNFLEKLNFTGQNDYKNGKRKFWYVDNELAGYVKYAGNLTDVLVRNGGHMVPVDQPKWVFDLINKFTRNKL